MSSEQFGGFSPDTATNAPSSIEKAFATGVFEERLRARQRQAWDAQDITAPTFNLDAYHQQADQIAVTYLAEAGITETDDRYANLYTTARTYSWDRMSDEEWNVGYRDQEQPDNFLVAGRTKLQVEQEQLFGRQLSNDGDVYRTPLKSDTAPADSIDQHEDTPAKTLEELQAEIDTLQGDVNTTFAKRMKVGIFRRKKKAALQADLDQKTLNLQALTTQRNALLVQRLRDENMTDEMIVEKVAEQSNNELDKAGAGQREAMIGTKAYQRTWNKVSERYANMDKKCKLAVGALTALAIVPVGFAGAFTAVGAAGYAGVRIGRTYQLNKAKLYKTPDTPPPIQFKNEEDEFRSVDDVLQDASTYQGKLLNERVEKGDKIKRNAVVLSLAAVAFTGVAAYAEHSDTIREAAGWIKERAIDAKEHVGGWFGDTNTIQVKPTIPDQGAGVPDGGGATTGDSGATSGNNFDISQFTDAQTIGSGEGWYQTFDELGISNATDQARLLNNDVLMAKLANMGVAYPDASVGGWGMNMTADGKLPTDALKLIHDTAKQSGFALSR